MDFVLKCRAGNDFTKYDVVIGGAVSDNIFNTMELYIEGLVDKGETIRRLGYEKPNLQICFKSQRAIDNYLYYEGSEEIWQLIQYYCRKNIPGLFNYFRKSKI